MAALHAGVNLETANLALQIGAPPGDPQRTGVQAAWVWVPVMPGETFTAVPVFGTNSSVHLRRAATAGHHGNSGALGASVLVWDTDDDRLTSAVAHALAWDFTQP